MQYLKRLQRPLYLRSPSLIHRNNPFYCNTFSFSSSIDQIELLELLKVHNNEKQQALSSESNEKHVDHLIEQIRTLHTSKEDKISSELALNACFFITHYHTDKALLLPPDNVDEFVKFQEIHQKDMKIGWDLLNTSNDSESTFDSNKSIWKIEMATRLEDTLKIYKSFMELYNAQNQDFNTFDTNQLMIGFSTIPYIGQWSLMLNLADILKTKIPDALISLYNMAQTLPIPDFTMIYEIVQQNERNFLENEIKIDNDEVITDYLDWRMYEFDAVRLKFKAVRCYKSMDDMDIDQDKEDMILNNMGAEMKQWTEVDVNNDDDDDGGSEQGSNLRKMGGICQAKSFYGYGDMIPIQLYGPWINDGIMVKGRVDIPIYSDKKGGNNNDNDNDNDNGNNNDDDDDDGKGDDKPAILIIHEEEWNLKKVDKNDRLFKGNYIVRQRNEILDKENIDPNGEQMKNFGPMDWIYDLEIVLK